MYFFSEYSDETHIALYIFPCFMLIYVYAIDLKGHILLLFSLFNITFKIFFGTKYGYVPALY